MIFFIFKNISKGRDNLFLSKLDGEFTHFKVFDYLCVSFKMSSNLFRAPKEWRRLGTEVIFSEIIIFSDKNNFSFRKKKSTHFRRVLKSQFLKLAFEVKASPASSLVDAELDDKPDELPISWFSAGDSRAYAQFWK